MTAHSHRNPAGNTRPRSVAPHQAIELCAQELFATTSALSARCQDFLDTCLPNANHQEEIEQCVASSGLLCREVL